jgi:alanine racemase
MVVVKADAFGHGAVPVARAALASGASWLGVARIEEAVALREAYLELDSRSCRASMGKHQAERWFFRVRLVPR